MNDGSNISSADFEAARTAIRKLGNSIATQDIIYEIESLQIKNEYDEMMQEGVLKEKEVTMRLMKKFGRSYGSIQHVARHKF